MPRGRRRRVDLEGNVAGEVSSEQRCRAERLVGRIEARQLAAETAAAKTKAESKGAARPAAAPPSSGKVVAMPLPAEMAPPSGSGRLGLADLKRTARERRARQEANRG
jgi:sRNA-binding protein